MTRPTVYCAAPYGSPSRAIRAWHIARARLLARIVLAEGGTPVLVHGEIEAGTYGRDDDPTERAIGLACAGSIAARCERIEVLLRDDGEASDGTKADVEAWCVAKHSAPPPGAWPDTWHARTTWADLRPRAERAGLLDAWAGLVAHPLACGGWEDFRGCSGRYRDGEDGIAAATALVDDETWCVYDDRDGAPIAYGPETGLPGRIAADRALAALGVPEPADGWAREEVPDAS